MTTNVVAKSLAARENTRTSFTLRHSRRLLLRAAAVALALGALAAPASAKPFQQYLNGACTGTICRISFAKVPAGSVLKVTNVSCYVNLDEGGGGVSPRIRAAQLLVVGANPNKVFNAVTIVPQYTEGSATSVIFAANHAITAFANGNQRFQAYAEIEAGTFVQFACHIGGDMVKA